MDKVNELKQDVLELETLLKTANRQRVKDILSIECRKLVTEIVNIENQMKTSPSPIITTKIESSAEATTGQQRYQMRLTNYAWDQSDKFVKFYVSLKDVHTIEGENVSCTFTERTMELNVRNLAGKDYVLTINHLLNPIKAGGSSWKVKTDMVVVTLSKSRLENWSHVTTTEKRSSEAKKMPDVDKAADPSDGLMSLMKNMYEQGDDEMKRTIAKAWTESQDKKKMM